MNKSSQFLLQPRFFPGNRFNLSPVIYVSSKLLLQIVANLMIFILSGCSISEIPKELKMNEPVYDASVSHFMGPAGSNKGFRVYELDDEVLDLIKANGLEFLNSMPSALNYEPVRSKPGYEGSIDRYSFTAWHSLPVPQDERWNYSSLHPKFNQKRPVLADYYGSQPEKVNANPIFTFDENIEPAHRETFHRVILQGKGYYCYGGFRNRELLVIDLTGKKIYHLYVR